MLQWSAHSLSHLHCLSNTMQGELAECKQRGDEWGLRAVEIWYDRAWIWWMTQLCHVQVLRMEVGLADLGPLFLATLSFSWTFLRATWCKFKLLFRRALGLHESYQHRGDVWTPAHWHMGKKWMGQRAEHFRAHVKRGGGLLRNSSGLGGQMETELLLSASNLLLKPTSVLSWHWRSGSTCVIRDIKVQYKTLVVEQLPRIALWADM